MYIKARIGWQALTKSEYLESGDYYLITGTDIDESSHTINLKRCFYVSKERYEMDDKIQVREGDIIVTKDGTIGKVAMVTGLDRPATLNSHLFVLRDLSGKVDNYFLLTVLNSHIFDSFVESTKTGSTLTGMPQKTFVEFSFLLPDIEEQKRIASFFRNLDHLITLHQCEQNAKISIKNVVLLALFTENEYNCAYYFKKEELFMTFKNEADFENALIKTLTESFGWEKEVLKYKTEKELLDNWKTILFENNRQKDRLNDYPLTDGEMQQIIEQIKELKTPLKLNGFINGRSVLIKRDNPDDKDNFGKEISLKIYDRNEIAAGQSRYQIAQQPVFKAKSGVLPDRRGDLMLLINGMPVIHIELKRSGKPVSEAYNQIEKYSNEGIFTGLFALVQVFVAMTPEETVYFANPGIDGVLNPQFYFQWADFNNEPIKDWKEIASQFLSIPMAHELIGYYTVADDNDGILKIMRSYQITAAKKISDKVAKNKWEHNHQLGGYIWHTTGSGKTMTSFKSAQLIANTKDADKVVFLIDRIELGTQSAREYRGFADDRETIQETEDTEVLVSKLKSPFDSDTLIVTSIQKMSNIRDDDSRKITEDELKTINSKRIVFIVDECHRSSFGDMMLTVKQTFPTALFFGFTGTPIQIENMKKGSTTADVFGDELHRYSIADGIRDKNVLGFDIEKVLTFEADDMRTAVALEKAKAKDVNEATSDPKKSKIFYKYMNEVPMASYVDDKGIKHTGIEEYMLMNGQYRTDEHQKMVVKDISKKWHTKSHNFKFHGIFATSSIPEAIDYYRLFKKTMPELNVTCLFDQHIDNDDASYNKEYRGQKIALFKEHGLIEIIEDYKTMFGQSYSMSTYDKMKKDIQARLAHKKPYERIAGNREQQLDLLIVVDQMLTGYDSKWINILYLDKLLKYENIIQAFSRTNRLFNEQEKPFGCVKYYRAPFTMEKNIQEAVKVYSGDKPFGLFVQKLDKNIENMNAVYTQIENLFNIAGVDNFSKLPDDKSEIQQFAKLFKQFNNYLNAAKIQGFNWEQSEYQFVDDTTGEVTEVKVIFDKKTYLVLVLRYKELFSAVQSGSDDDTPYDLTGYITTIDTDKIDVDYMNSRFEKYRKALINGTPEDIEATKEELHKTFATLTQDEQKYANIFLHDIQNGDVEIVEGKSLRDYINEYMESAKNDQIHRCATAFGLDEHKLRSMMGLKLTDKNINEFNRLDKLMATVDMVKAQEYFSKNEGKPCARPFVIIKLDKLLTKFIISGGFEI